MAGRTVVPKEWRNDTKDHCAATDASIRQANKLREEAEWLIEERKNVTERAQKDVKFPSMAYMANAIPVCPSWPSEDALIP